MSNPDEASTRAAYDMVAPTYARVFTATEPEQPLDLALIDHFVGLLDRPRRVLDAGCGAGRMLPYLAARGCRPIGIDLSPQMVQHAYRNHPGYPVAVATLSQLPFSDDEFDGVFAWYSIIHTPDHGLDRVLAEMARVTRPGGHMLVAFQVGHGRRLVGQGFRAYGLDVEMHRYHRSTVEVAHRLRAVGLEVVANMQRQPVGSEADPQAVVVARRA